MRSAPMIEDEELSSSPELNLGMGSLIGIFFGLALVCGVFFGFGYMMGHRTPGPYVSSDPLYVSPKTPATAPKPSAQIADQPSDAARVIVPANAPSPGEAAAPSENAPDRPESRKTATQLSSSPEPRVTLAATNPSHASTPQPVVAPPSAASAVPLSTPSSGTIMVQIAAVKNSPDAEALAAALRNNGFNPTIRSESQDKLIHVQVGPFANRDEARAMRQKLSNAGYNAFIK